MNMENNQATSQQDIISNFWQKTSEKIFSTDDKYNLTTFVQGEYKHAAEVGFLKNMGIITPEATILDLACGNGRLCETLSQSVKWVTGTDLCENFITYLNEWKTRNAQMNVDFFSLDLLERDYSKYFTRQYSIILLFGLTQIIIKDDALVKILMNITPLLEPNGKLLIKQTTSIVQDDIHIDHFSTELKHHWIAKYRTQSTMASLCQQAGLRVVNTQQIYSPENLGAHYQEVERWDNTKQIIFEVIKES